jgi:ATP/maltotriose-dependent transcriptional regulator MalT
VASRKTVSTVLQSLLFASKHRLTFRETEILGLVANGLKNREIAKRLLISPETVRWHLRTLYNKLGTHDRMRAVIKVRWRTSVRLR